MFLFNIPKGDIGYDIETYPNVFTFMAEHCDTGEQWCFEISDWRNDLWSLCRFIEACGSNGNRWVGYNNIGFDYPVVHYIYKAEVIGITVAQIYEKAMAIINAHGNAKFAHMVWESDWLVEQVDIYEVHHFDNQAKATSLKVLEFNMRSDDISDLPFEVGSYLTADQVPVLKQYNGYDVAQTVKFFKRPLTQQLLKLRADLTPLIGKNLTNVSDVKLGEEILVHELDKAGVSCYHRVGGRREKKQTKRDSVDLGAVVFPYVRFERQEFNNILNFFKSKVITETKGVFTGLIASVDGLEYKFGTGGLHASIESSVVASDEEYQIIDVDVASFYPNLGIKNKLFPAHLGTQFCDAYEGVYHTRKTFPKKTSENGAYKLALNGAYGNSNNEYSPFFDTQYTMSITVNGQLLLCMLAEQLIKVPGLKMIQANTDGVTYLCPRQYIEHTRNVCRWWEQITNLELEEALYSRMFIRDVNSYIAEYEDGSLKRIGAYAYETAEENPATRELPYHKDWSARVTQMAAEAALVRGESIRHFIENHDDVFDFFLRTKVPRSSILEWGGEQVPNIVRYYIDSSGKPLEKVMPPKGPQGAYKRANGLTDEFYDSVIDELLNNNPHIEEHVDPSSKGTYLQKLIALLPHDERINTKNKSTYEERRSGICTGWNVTVCNRLHSHDVGDYDINYEWYIAEAEKLVKPLLNF